VTGQLDGRLSNVWRNVCMKSLTDSTLQHPPHLAGRVFLLMSVIYTSNV
jgi:hypothetical protein